MPTPIDSYSRHDDSSTATEPDAGIVNVSGYRFVPLDCLPVLQADLDAALRAADVLGTILLAEEGINVALAGTATAIAQAIDALDQDPRLAGLWLKRSTSSLLPFSKLKVRIRREIIAFDGQDRCTVPRPMAPQLAPERLRRWLDGERRVQLLDTRNEYEIEAGGFEQATSLGIDHFRDFKAAVEVALDEGRLALDEPLVTFCTGGIRCEKAAPWLLERGFGEVHQIEGGILNWFERQGDAHWSGDCFVFDDRVCLTPQLDETGAALCKHCHRAFPGEATCACDGARVKPDRLAHPDPPA